MPHSARAMYPCLSLGNTGRDTGYLCIVLARLLCTKGSLREAQSSTHRLTKTIHKLRYIERRALPLKRWHVGNRLALEVRAYNSVVLYPSRK